MLPQIFSYQDNQIRVIMLDGQPWWVAKDVCDILDITWSGGKTLDRISDKHKGVVNFPTPGGEQELWTIDEPGLYKLIMRSSKPEAERFQDWVTEEVIPQIRATGSYSIENPKKLIALALVEAQKIIEQKDEQIAIMAPKADFFDQVASSKDAIDLGSAAKVLNMGIGRNRLFEILRDEKVLMQNNQPYQTFIDRGYFRTIEQKYTVPTGETRISIKTLVYQRGLNYIRQVLEKAV